MHNQLAQAVRQINGSQLGHLVTVRGIVTRVSDVRPCLQVNAYSCDTCGHEVFQEVTQRQFTPLAECQSEVCKTHKSRGKLFMQTRASKFLAFQEVKLQELVSWKSLPNKYMEQSQHVLTIKSFLRPIKFLSDISQEPCLFICTANFVDR
jgi:DNA replicative helicase MCM subunit Mcm2 (Cdc46/Mcm family)